MATIIELARLAQAAYQNEGKPQDVPGWRMTHARWGVGWDSFQGIAFEKGEETVVAFRGTTLPESGHIAAGLTRAASDMVTDLQLGVGSNAAYFSQAEDFVRGFAGHTVSICGHSLGGAIAQIVGNRHALKFATFNAPGVAVLASRQFYTGNGDGFVSGVSAVGHVAALPLRAVVSVGSMLRYPVQGYRDVAASFRRVHGINICLNGDYVSKLGLHYGRMRHIPGDGHGIAIVIKALEAEPDLADKTIDDLA